MRYHIEFDFDLRRNSYKGLYIAIEGVDGSGKTTQVVKIKSYLQRKGHEVLTTKEPVEKGRIGVLIREILSLKVAVPSVTIQYLLAADRAANLETTVIPALLAGKTIISDRCFWSAVPYGMADLSVARQGRSFNYEQGEVLLVAQSILSMYHQFIVPDFTFYLDVSVDTALRRLSKMKKVKELYERREKLERIEKGYRWLIRKFPKEITVIDGERPVDVVTQEILNKLPK